MLTAEQLCLLSPSLSISLSPEAISIYLSLGKLEVEKEQLQSNAGSRVALTTLSFLSPEANSIYLSLGKLQVEKDQLQQQQRNAGSGAAALTGGNSNKISEQEIEIFCLLSFF